MKNNKGITLVELIAVLAVLAMITLIVVPNVIKQVKRSEQQVYDSQVVTIEAAAQGWAADHTESLPNEVGKTYQVTISSLQQEGYLDSNLINALTNQKFDKNTYVVITCIVANESNYNYSYKYVS